MTGQTVKNLKSHIYEKYNFKSEISSALYFAKIFNEKANNIDYGYEDQIKGISKYLKDKSLNKYKLGNISTIVKSTNEFEQQCKLKIPNGSCFAMFIAVHDNYILSINYTAHWIYGQKIEGEILFFDFQRNKPKENKPSSSNPCPTTQYPTFPDVKHTGINELLDNNKDLKIKVAAIHIDTIPKKIQPIIKNGLRDYAKLVLEKNNIDTQLNMQKLEEMGFDVFFKRCKTKEYTILLSVIEKYEARASESSKDLNKLNKFRSLILSNNLTLEEIENVARIRTYRNEGILSSIPIINCLYKLNWHPTSLQDFYDIKILKLIVHN